ncbi:hypothetical protein [Roseibium marinum]|uniref:Uncharacterized protein n=1 Tax=Roseibium marinum TaxID=281252 RepID=A0A2S3V1Q8_9HYPH|nr:hypothetical protein [Roseibium marinum]POF33845.1 hypothetical protein CLV41_101294 [Roseibium marinum]
MTTLIKTTEDGRKVEVNGLAICLDGKLEAFELIEVAMHPNRRAIVEIMSDATHMAGRIALTREDVRKVEEAFAETEKQILASPAAINERFRLAVKRRTCSEGIE